MREPSTNQRYREALAAERRCRHCEVPLLASEANYARCGPCRAWRNYQRARRRGDSGEALDRAIDRYTAAIDERARLLGRDDGAGAREAVRRERRGR